MEECKIFQSSKIVTKIADFVKPNWGWALEETRVENTENFISGNGLPFCFGCQYRCPVFLFVRYLQYYFLFQTQKHGFWQTTFLLWVWIHDIEIVVWDTGTRIGFARFVPATVFTVLLSLPDANARFLADDLFTFDCRPFEIVGWDAGTRIGVARFVRAIFQNVKMV
jgi:hypothetical protein